MDVVNRTWQVLFYDRRPSWASTFVRRALEDDARFSVRSRTQTSTGVAIERGDVPASLGAVDRIDAFDAVVVGAPAALSPVEVQTLEEFAHRRGGAVVVLLDGPASGPLGGLTRANAWTTSTLPAATPVETDPARLVASRSHGTGDAHAIARRRSSHCARCRRRHAPPGGRSTCRQAQAASSSAA